ncbi:MAG: dual specificity protein phosphatase family protein [Anaerolineaceae bacterium]
MSQNLIEIPFGLPGKIYRSPLPNGIHDIGGTTLLEFLIADIDTVLTLVEESEWQQDLRQVYRQNHLKMIYLPIADYMPPTDALEISNALSQVLQLAKNGKNVAIHCNAGIGRTGMVLSLLARCVFHFDGTQATAWVRNYLPHAVESDGQSKFVAAFDCATVRI